MIHHHHEHDKEHKETMLSEELDHASHSLSEALRISFFVLKIIMIVLVLAFLALGICIVAPDEQVIVLRFGKIQGIGEERLLGPGLHWVFPYPIDAVIRIPVEKKVNLAVGDFWYFQNPTELLPDAPKLRRVPQDLNPLLDGYCLTRGGSQNPKGDISAGSDYGIIHCKWQVVYNIDDPERFYRNVFVEDIKPGDVYFDVITESVSPLLTSVIGDAVVTTMVNYNIEEALFSSQNSIVQDIKQLIQLKLDSIESGIRINSVQLTDMRWPRQVDRAFQASIAASQASQQAADEAKGYAENTLNEAAGPIAEELLSAIKDQKNMTQQEQDYLWSQAAGQAQEKLAQARAYRTEVVENAKANAEYLKSVLPEYQKRPELFIQELYRDTIETVLNNAEEKIIIQPVEGQKGSDVWIMLNRDPGLQKEQTTE
ncbi:MAG: protease modulator HflK [Planctomycetota bacterium]|jgi:membrane protease subunit HflK